MDDARANSAGCFINSRHVISGRKAVFSTHKGTKINTVAHSEHLNVMVQLYHKFHWVLWLSLLMNIRGLLVREFKDMR